MVSKKRQKPTLLEKIKNEKHNTWINERKQSQEKKRELAVCFGQLHRKKTD